MVMHVVRDHRHRAQVPQVGVRGVDPSAISLCDVRHVVLVDDLPGQRVDDDDDDLVGHLPATVRRAVGRPVRRGGRHAGDSDRGSEGDEGDESSGDEAHVWLQLQSARSEALPVFRRSRNVAPAAPSAGLLADHWRFSRCG